MNQYVAKSNGKRKMYINSETKESALKTFKKELVLFDEVLEIVNGQVQGGISKKAVGSWEIFMVEKIDNKEVRISENQFIEMYIEHELSKLSLNGNEAFVDENGNFSVILGEDGIYNLYIDFVEMDCFDLEHDEDNCDCAKKFPNCFKFYSPAECARFIVLNEIC